MPHALEKYQEKTTTFEDTDGMESSLGKTPQNNISFVGHVAVSLSHSKRSQHKFCVAYLKTNKGTG